ncbi:MAG: hypothetical protein CMF96_11935 [Candidatus Marinimicrobia bacterium]|nr:hypothetical protein [Candidatus Neomarinimicrobiota bacterium]|tara:strand:- start:5291 stop:5881 length:591 start_codon:yes stop_codon:yes gene_type:complete
MITQSKKKISGLRAVLKTLLIVGGTLLIPFYVVYFNTDIEDKKEFSKSSKQTAKSIDVHKSLIETSVVESKVNQKKIILPEKDNLHGQSFDMVYKYHRDHYGEGSLFKWDGNEYIVNTYIEEIPVSKYDDLHFSDAFKEARQDKGICSKFNWRGNKYSSCKHGEKLEIITNNDKERVESKNKERITKNEEQTLANK